MAFKKRVNLDIGYAEAPGFGDVEVGDRLLPPWIDVTLPSADGQPGLSMRLEVVDGIPECRAVRIESVEGGRAVRPADLKAVHLADWVDDFFALFATRITQRHVDGSPAAAVIEVMTADRHVESVQQIRAARKGKGARKIDDAFLAGVADVYREHFSDGPTKAVAAVYGVEIRTAAMYVQRARAAGHLGPTVRGKKGV
jgi:hypothetical protein